jgi:hypothetical protein
MIHWQRGMAVVGVAATQGEALRAVVYQNGLFGEAEQLKRRVLVHLLLLQTRWNDCSKLQALLKEEEIAVDDYYAIRPLLYYYLGPHFRQG